MNFVISNHAEKMMRTRGIKPPSSEMNLRHATGKTLRKIKESCPKSFGRLRGTEYFRLNKNTIYVCRRIGKKEYVLITAFVLGDEKKKKK